MASLLSMISALLPFKTLLLVVFLCYVKVQREPLSVALDTTAEFYPLSSFPMFSTFADNARYVHLADGEGEPVLPSVYNSSTGSLSKSYRKYLLKEKKKKGQTFDELALLQRRAAGDQLLRDLRESVAPAAFENGTKQHLRLYEVVLRRDAEGKLVREREMVGEYVGTLAVTGGVDAAP
jgi:hypothetical protein